MKKLFLIFTMLLILILTACEPEEPVDDNPIPDDPDPITYCKATHYDYDQDSLQYDLVWFDEFDYEGTPDPSKWTFNIGGGGWGNNEEQYYTNQNASVSDGVLTIEAKNEDYRVYEYTSARLVSKENGDFTYGKIEVRAKLPEGRGTWPAIWMLPTYNTYGGWPNSGEIDIMEHVGYDMNKIHGTVHTDAYNHMKGTQKGGSKTLDDVSDTYHTYSIEWLPDKIDYYIDGEKYYTFEPSKYTTCPTESQWPFDIPFHLILNIAIGGNWGGVQGVDESIFPQSMEIDYVRVYQSEEITNLEQK